jgi:hypothetical protein
MQLHILLRLAMPGDATRRQALEECIERRATAIARAGSGR